MKKLLIVLSVLSLISIILISILIINKSKAKKNHSGRRNQTAISGNKILINIVTIKKEK